MADEKTPETRGTSRRSFFVDLMSWGAGLWVASTALSACSDDVAAKYGGPTQDFGPKKDGSQADQMVTKYGGPPDASVDVPVAKYGGPRDLGKADAPVAKYGGPRDLGKVDGVKRDGLTVKYGGPRDAA